MTPDVSVIVPVYNQASDLFDCLRALQFQSYGMRLSNPIDIIVVDNGFDAEIVDMIKLFPFATYTFEPQPGSYAARNRGIRAARSEILAFLDADCVPAPDWLERGLAAVQALPGPGFVGGRVDLTYQDPAHLTGAELFERQYGFQQQSYVRDFGFAVTANLWTTKATMREVGVFDERFFSGADVEWGQRVSRRLTAVYADDVRVTHPARRTLGALCRRSLRVAGGIQQLQDRRGYGVSGLGGVALRELIGLSTLRLAPLHGLDRLRFLGVGWLVRAAQILESYRVHYGGLPRRA